MTTSNSNSGRLAGLYQRVEDLFSNIPHDIIALIARYSIGMTFWLSARTKVDGWALKDVTFLLFENEYHFPQPFHVPAAYAATIAEHLLPILLWLGLATRLSALGLLVMTLVIQFWVFPSNLLTYHTHGLWVVALLYLLKFGPGRFSIDCVLRRS